MTWRAWLSLAVLASLIWLVPTSIFWPLGQPVSERVLSIYSAPGLYLTDFIVALVILLSIWRFTSRRLDAPQNLWVNVKYIGLPIIILIFLAGLSIISARSFVLATYNSARWLFAAVLFYALVRIHFSNEKFITLLTIGLGFQAVVGLAQVINQGPLHLPGELALEVTQARAALIHIDNTYLLRAYGLTFHPNVLGGYLCAGLLLSLPLLLKKWVRPIWWLMGIGLLLSFSRSAWLAAALTIPISVLWLNKHHPELRRPILWTVLPAVIAVMIVGITLMDEIVTRLNPLGSYSEFTSLVGRGELIDISLKVIQARPLTGIGAGNFPLVMLSYQTLDPPHYVHNIPLLLASEVGLLGGLLWYWLWLAPAVKITSILKKCTLWNFSFVMAWFAWGIISMWDSYPWGLESGRLFSVILLALIAREMLSIKTPLRVSPYVDNQV